MLRISKSTTSTLTMTRTIGAASGYRIETQLCHSARLCCYSHGSKTIKAQLSKQKNNGEPIRIQLLPVDITQPDVYKDIWEEVMDYIGFHDLISLSKVSKLWYNAASLERNVYQWGKTIYYLMCDLDMLKCDNNMLNQTYGKWEWFKNEYSFYNENFLLLSCNYKKKKFIEKILPIIGKKCYYFVQHRDIGAKHGIFWVWGSYSPYLSALVNMKDEEERYKQMFEEKVEPEIKSSLQEASKNARKQSLQFYIRVIAGILLNCTKLTRDICEYENRLIELGYDNTYIDPKKQSFWSKCTKWVETKFGDSTNDQQNSEHRKILDKLLYKLTLLFGMVSWFCSVENEFKYDESEKDEKYSLFVNESMLKLMLKLIDDKFDNINNENYIFKKTNWFSSWIEFFATMHWESMAALTDCYNIPFEFALRWVNELGWQDDRDLLERLYYAEMGKSISLNNVTKKYDLKRNVCIWRNMIILTMYFFGNKRFTLNENTRKCFDKVIGKNSKVKNDKYHKFDHSISSFIKNSQYYKHMILLDSLLLDKSNNEQFICPQYKEFSNNLAMIDESNMAAELNAADLRIKVAAHVEKCIARGGSYQLDFGPFVDGCLPQ